MPTGLRKCNTKLRAYNGTNIPQLGALETTITWKDKETKEVNKMDTTFYIPDTPVFLLRICGHWSIRASDRKINWPGRKITVPDFSI